MMPSALIQRLEERLPKLSLPLCLRFTSVQYGFTQSFWDKGARPLLIVFHREDPILEVFGRTGGVLTVLEVLNVSTTYSALHTYVLTYIYIHIHRYVHRYVHTYAHTYVHTYVHTYIRTSTDVPWSYSKLNASVGDPTVSQHGPRTLVPLV